MDWNTVVLGVLSLDPSIVALVIILAAISTSFIYHRLETSLYVTCAILAILSSIGLFGHVIFLLMDVVFVADPAQNVVVGAAASMTICVIVALIAGRIMADAVYGKYGEPENDEPRSTIVR